MVNISDIYRNKFGKSSKFGFTFSSHVYNASILEIICQSALEPLLNNDPDKLKILTN